VPVKDFSPHQVFVGIDIGYKTHVACAIPGAFFNAKKYPDGWKRAKTLHFSSDASGFKKLQGYLDKLSVNPADFLTLCEPTGGYYGLAMQMYLLGKGYTMLQVGNATVGEYRKNVYGSETKTDDMDARLMARMGFLHEWIGEEFSIQAIHFVTPDESILRLMTRDYIKLTKEINRRRSQLHQILAVTFPELKTFFKDSVTGIAARNLIKKYPTTQELRQAPVEDIAMLLHTSGAYKHEKRAGELINLAQTSAGLQAVNQHLWRQGWILSQLDALEEAQKALFSQISQLILSHPYTPIIESFPLRSPIWTATLIGVIGNIDRFHNYGQFRAYVGWFPKVEQSGSSINSSKLSPSGARLGRKVFGQMAMTLISPQVRDTPFRIYYKRLTARGMRPITALGHLAGKLASVFYECLKTEIPYDEAKHRKQMGLQTEVEAPLPPIEVQDIIITPPETTEVPEIP
jgi:transposase